MESSAPEGASPPAGTSSRDGAQALVLGLVVGLGNPGERYTSTRHNVGFRVVEEMARRRAGEQSEAAGQSAGKTESWETESWRSECNSRVFGLPEPGSRPVDEDSAPALVLPQTYMNRSGFALRCLFEHHDLRPERILVVYDEIHLPLGKLRLRGRGSPGGHRGMESVVENLGTDRIPRLRLGVAGEGSPGSGESLVDYVLSPFAEEEIRSVDEMILRAADACEVWAREGNEAAMRQFNG